MKPARWPEPWGLGKLVVFYDDNGISIDGEVEGWFTDNTPERFRSYGWQVIESVDGHDPAAVDRAIKEAKSNPDQPTLICCRTQIWFWLAEQGRHRRHSWCPAG